MDSLRVPPHSVEAEQAVLGGLMLSESAWERVSLDEADFYRRDHALIYRAMGGLVAKNQPIDAVTLGEWFEREGLADQVGGSRYVLELASTTPSAANIGAYAGIVREKAMLRRVIDAATQIASAGYDPSGKSSAEVLDGAIGALMSMHRRERRAEWAMKDVLKLAFDRITHAWEHKGEIVGVPCGLAKLDAHLGGFHPSDLTVIGARPAMGKTALLLGMARHAAANGYPVGVVSGEQPAVQLGLRMVALSSGVDASKFRSGHLSDEDWSRVSAAMRDDHGLPIHVYDKAAPSIADVMRCARRWKREHGIRALYVDYLQRLEGPGERSYERVSAIAKGLKNIARDLDIPVIVLAQVKREVESRTDKRPHMGDLCDSSEIEKEADQILTLYRDDYYNEQSEQAGTAEIIIDKNRHGECVTVRVAWLAQVMRFADYESASRWDRAA